MENLLEKRLDIPSNLSRWSRACGFQRRLELETQQLPGFILSLSFLPLISASLGIYMSFNISHHRPAVGMWLPTIQAQILWLHLPTWTPSLTLITTQKTQRQDFIWAKYPALYYYSKVWKAWLCNTNVVLEGPTPHIRVMPRELGLWGGRLLQVVLTMVLIHVSPLSSTAVVRLRANHLPVTYWECRYHNICLTGLLQILK